MATIILGPPLLMISIKGVIEALDTSVRRPLLLPVIPELDPLQLGYLARGRKGVIEAALAKLVLRGNLEVSVEHGILEFRTYKLPTGLSNLEKQVMSKVLQSRTLKKLYRNEDICREIKKSLKELHLQPQGCGALLTWVLYAAALPLSLFPLILASWFPQIAILFYTFSFLFAIVGFGSISLLGRLGRTQWGDYVVKHYREQQSIHKEIEIGVALYGYTVMRHNEHLEALGRACERYYRDYVWDC